MKRKINISPPQILALGFFCIILLGTLLLCIPISSADGYTHFADALFTATSATCVTGLVTLNTATHWTLFGKIVILILIQTGGLGFMTFISLSAFIAKKKLNLKDRQLIMQSSGSLEINELSRFLKKIVIGTVIVESIGAILLSIRFWTYGHNFITGLWYGIFHSISAFCNAGFDVLGDSSIEQFYNDPYILLVLSILIIVGGIGFLVWDDITKHGLRIKRYSLHSKLALSITGVLLLIGTLVLYGTEYNYAFSGLNEWQKWLNAFFESVTLRTAGFAAVNQGSLSPAGTIFSCALMLIGGSPGSTAGGIKTVTFFVVIINAVALAKSKNSLTIFKKRIHDSVIKQATAIISLYLALAITVIIVLLILEPDMATEDIIFEVFSAIATVGLTRGITPSLCIASKIIIAFTMYFGRLGGLTLLLALTNTRPRPTADRPYGKILIG